MTRVGVVTGDVLGDRMAGPAIRAWNIAHQLAPAHEVTLVSTQPLHRTSQTVTLVHAPPGDLARTLRTQDVLIVQGLEAHRRTVLTGTTAMVIVDLYDPFHVEALEATRPMTAIDRAETVRNITALANEQLLLGDAFVCASERQRDFWLGALGAMGRLNPATYDADPTLRSLIDVVPFGVGDEPPQRVGPGLRATLGLDPSHLVLLWGGGVYDWFDPLTPIRAVAALRGELPAIRLVFLGMRHPNPHVAPSAAAAHARSEAARLHVTGREVLFHEDWVPYDERGAWLLDATAGVSAHHDHLETAFSFRTRILDYLWAGLPVIATRGDVLADLVEGAGAGRAVGPGDVDGFAAAVVDLARHREQWSGASAALSSTMGWSRAIAPLRAWCATPRQAADRPTERSRAPVRAPAAFLDPPSRGPRYWAAGTAHAWRRGGARLVVRKVVGRLNSRLMRR